MNGFWKFLAAGALIWFLISTGTLKKLIPSFPSLGVGNVSVTGTPFKKTAGPVVAKAREVRFVAIQPTAMVVDSYVKASVVDVQATQKIDRSWDFDTHPRMKLKKGKSISVDTLIGYDPARKGSFFWKKVSADKSSVTLVINPNMLVALQSRVVPFANQDKLDCNDDRWFRPATESGSCGDLAVGILDASVAAFQVGCLKKVWPSIKVQIRRAEQIRNRYLLLRMKKLYPQFDWKSTHLKVVFKPDRPALTKIPPGWSWKDKHGHNWKKGAGDIYLVKAAKKGSHKTTFKVNLTHIVCSLDRKSLKTRLYSAATNEAYVPAA